MDKKIFINSITRRKYLTPHIIVLDMEDDMICTSNTAESVDGQDGGGEEDPTKIRIVDFDHSDPNTDEW